MRHVKPTLESLLRFVQEIPKKLQGTAFASVAPRGTR